jgi:hypothetical protein
MSIRIGHFIDSLCPFMTCKILFSSAKNNFTYDWNIYRTIGIDPIGIGILILQYVSSQRHSVIGHCDGRVIHLGDMDIFFVLTNIFSKFLLHLECCYNRQEYLCLWDQCQWSCIYFNHNKLFHHPDWTHDTMWQYNFLTYM